MNFFSRYEWTSRAKFFCGMFVIVGLMSVSDGRQLGWFYLFVGLYCAWAWKLPKDDTPVTSQVENDPT